MTGQEDLWLRRFHPVPDPPARMVCLPHAGGAASFYFPLSRALSPAVEMLAVQYPGRQDRYNEPALVSIEELAHSVLAVVRGRSDRPLALFGHSMGALVAFELATLLEAHGSVPAALFVSGRRAPDLYRREDVHERSDEEVLAELGRLSGTHAALLGDDELVRMILPAVRADYRAVETYRYRPRPPLRCPITALVGDSDPRVTIAEAEGWANHTTSAFAVRVFPGGHFYLADHQEEITALVKEQLAPMPSAQHE